MRVAFIASLSEAGVELIKNSAKMALQYEAESRALAMSERGDRSFKMEPQTVKQSRFFRDSI